MAMIHGVSAKDFKSCSLYTDYENWIQVSVMAEPSRLINPILNA